MIRLKALGIQFNPIDGCQYSSELSAQLNLTNDHKKKKHQTCKHALSPDHVSMPDMWSVSGAALKKEVVIVASSYAEAPGG